jgi:hypothetical protein
MLRKRGFSSKWLNILKTIQDKGSMGASLHDENNKFFMTWRWVRQGDPASPILFNFMADVFAKNAHVSWCKQPDY